MQITAAGQTIRSGSVVHAISRRASDVGGFYERMKRQKIAVCSWALWQTTFFYITRKLDVRRCAKNEHSDLHRNTLATNEPQHLFRGIITCVLVSGTAKLIKSIVHFVRSSTYIRSASTSTMHRRNAAGPKTGSLPLLQTPHAVARVVEKVWKLSAGGSQLSDSVTWPRRVRQSDTLPYSKRSELYDTPMSNVCCLSVSVVRSSERKKVHRIIRSFNMIKRFQDLEVTETAAATAHQTQTVIYNNIILSAARLLHLNISDFKTWLVSIVHLVDDCRNTGEKCCSVLYRTVLYRPGSLSVNLQWKLSDSCVNLTDIVEQ